ncbi:MAG TPA: hypothetical protein VMT21_09250 [Gemmatimonadales bacterium]|nr:hypothetical protein [Gemmatimonadales bacterium]
MTAPALRIAIAATLCIGAGATLAAPLRAQTEFAVPVARGTLRFDITPYWLSYDHWYGLGIPGYADGAPVPINLAFQAESLGTQSLPYLGPLQRNIQAASGLLGAFSLNLGHTTAVMNASVRTIPIGLEYGLTGRLAIGVTVPIVRSRVDVNFAVDTATGKRSNVAFANPDSVSPFRSQVDAALAALQQQANSGPASLRDSALAMLSRLQPFGYLAHSALLPLGTSLAGDSVGSRLSSAETSYRQLAALYASNGVTLPALKTALALPDSATTRADLERFFSDSTLPLAGDTIGTIVRTGIGDITAHATYQLAEGKRYRGQVLVTVQFPTGGTAYTSSFLDLGTGTHQFAVEAALANDVILGSNFLVHAVARMGEARADDLERRVTPPDLPFAPIAQLAMVHRKPGAWFGVEVAPTWMLDDAFSVRLMYSYFNQAQTHYSYVNPADSARVGMSAGVLDQDTDQKLSRIGGAVTFNTLSRYLAGTASLPYILTVSYENTVWGRGGRVPQASIFRIQLRAYLKIF